MAGDSKAPDWQPAPLPTNYLLLKTRGKAVWWLVIIGLLVAGAGGFLLWRAIA